MGSQRIRNQERNLYASYGREGISLLLPESIRNQLLQTSREGFSGKIPGVPRINAIARKQSLETLESKVASNG